MKKKMREREIDHLFQFKLILVKSYIMQSFCESNQRVWIGNSEL